MPNIDCLNIILNWPSLLFGNINSSKTSKRGGYVTLSKFKLFIFRILKAKFFQKEGFIDDEYDNLILIS